MERKDEIYTSFHFLPSYIFPFLSEFTPSMKRDLACKTKIQTLYDYVNKNKQTSTEVHIYFMKNCFCIRLKLMIGKFKLSSI